MGSRRWLAAGPWRLELLIHGHAGDYRIERESRTHEVSGARLVDGALSMRIDGAMRRFHANASGDRILVHDGERRLRLQAVEVYRRQQGAADAAEHRIRAPMPGRVVLVIEAMKMELALKAPRDGILADVRVQAGDFVEADAVLATLEP